MTQGGGDEGRAKLAHSAFGVEPSDAKYRLRLARYVDLAERIKRVCESRHGVRILDLGCGKGRLRAFCGGMADGIEWHGFDLQEWRLAEAAGTGGYHLARGDLLQGLPYAAGSFDIVACVQVLEHLENPALVLPEIRRVMKPGGVFLLSVPSFPPLAAAAASAAMSLARLSKRMRERLEGGHVRFFSVLSLRRLLRDFEIREISGQRVLSVKALENYRFFYRLNRFLGSRLPWLAVEVTAEAVPRRDGDGSFTNPTVS